MQSQDYSMGKWAIGIRLPGSTDNDIESAIDKGEILRIHVLRPTWHFIGSDDIYWMLQLSAPKILSSLKTRHKQLELTEDVIKKSRGILESRLAKVFNLTREEISAELLNAGIRTDENRLSHLLSSFELDGIVCSGPKKGNKLTFSLLRERVPVKKELTRDESLAELAKRYFLSRCPATLQDFAWWSNLSLTDVRKATELIKPDFFTETIGSSVYCFPKSYSGAIPSNSSVYLLPAYDEFLISYRDRSSSLSEVYNKHTVSINGIFYPSIVINGQVAGLWRRKIQKNNVIIETSFFKPPSRKTAGLTEKKAGQFGIYLGKECVITDKSGTFTSELL